MIFVHPKEKRQGADLGTGGRGNKSELQLIELCQDITIVNVCWFSFAHIRGFLLTLAFRSLHGMFVNTF